MAIDLIDMNKLITMYYEKSNKNSERKRKQLFKHGLVTSTGNNLTERGMVLVEDLIRLANLVAEEVYIKEDKDIIVDTVYISFNSSPLKED